MKRIFVLATAFISFWLSACQNQNSNVPATTSSVSSGEGSRIAYINNDTLITYYKYYDALSKDLQDKVAKGEKQVAARGRKLEEEIVAFQQRAQAGLVSQNEARTKEAELMRKQQEWEASRQAQAQGLMAEEQDMRLKLHGRITSYLKEYNKDKKYSVILGYTEGTNIWLADDALDITQEVLAALNKAYDAEVAAAPKEAAEKK